MSAHNQLSESQAMDWMRCSKCFVHFAVEQKMCLSSCGHLMCRNCLNFEQEVVRSSVCIVCQRPNISLVNINQLKPDIKQLFRAPCDLFKEFSVQLSKVMVFQQNNRMRLKERQAMEKQQYAGRYNHKLKVELKNSAEKERILLKECNRMKAEMERYKEQTQHLKTKLVGIEKQYKLHACKLQLHSRNPNRAIPSLNGNTPLIGLSFSECAMSTPNNLPIMPQTNQKDAGNNLLMTPILDESVIAGPVRMPDTPAFFRYRKPVASTFF